VATRFITTYSFFRLATAVSPVAAKPGREGQVYVARFRPVKHACLQGLAFRVLGSEFRVRGSEFGVRSSEFNLQFASDDHKAEREDEAWNPELRTPNTEPRTLNPELRTPNTEPRTLNPEP